MDRWVTSVEERWIANPIYRWIPMDQGTIWLTKDNQYYRTVSETATYLFLTDQQRYQYDTFDLNYKFITKKIKQTEEQ